MDKVSVTWAVLEIANKRIAAAGNASRGLRAKCTKLQTQKHKHKQSQVPEAMSNLSSSLAVKRLVSDCAVSSWSTDV